MAYVGSDNAENGCDKGRDRCRFNLKERHRGETSGQRQQRKYDKEPR
jgi:hypothetical protein